MAGGAGEHVHLGPPVARQLDGDVAGGPEAVEADARRSLGSGKLERAVADDTGAQQWGGALRAGSGGQTVCEGGPRDDLLGVATVHIPAGEQGAGAEIPLPPQAVVADATGPVEPGEAHRLPHLEAYLLAPELRYRADNLVPRHKREPVRRQVALDDVQVRAADGAGVHFDHQFIGSRLRVRYLAQLQWCALDGPLFRQQHCLQCDAPLRQVVHGLGHLFVAGPTRPPRRSPDRGAPQPLP